MPIIIVGATPARRPAPPLLNPLRLFSSGMAITWSAQGDGGAPITQYVVTIRRTDTNAVVRLHQTPTAATTTFTLTNLTDGLEYSVTVAAINAVGMSPESNIALGVPGVAEEPPPDEGEEQPPPEEEPPPPPVIRPQPDIQAFSLDEPFHPSNWLASA